MTYQVGMKSLESMRLARIFTRHFRSRFQDFLSWFGKIYERFVRVKSTRINKGMDTLASCLGGCGFTHREYQSENNSGGTNYLHYYRR